MTGALFPTAPTPRTDAAIIRDKMILSEVGLLEIVDAGTCRQLERDLAAAREELASERERAERADELVRISKDTIDCLNGSVERAEARAEAAERDAGRWRACLDSVGVAVSIFNLDPAGWRYPEGDHLIAAIDNIIEGNDGAWMVPIDTGGPPIRAPFELKAQSRESIEARFYRYLRDEAGQYAEDTDGPMICAGLGDQFDYLRGEECDEAIRKAIDTRAAIAEGK